ncbi:putative geraniol 8-hydroxylase [Lupinus albus]|uniref:Putative geraniol 8-hydroxylase n=1 Tax=Lupinus albus TaxID=3870 RepID=A0A6A4QCS0_LUPAL|nr:putative geraniol 8-hydroxylase [Lupinus albus]
MEVHIFLFFLTLSLAIIRFFHNRHNNNNQPPGPTALPIIGNLHQLGSKPHSTLSSLAQTHGPLISLRFGSVTVVVASSPATVKLLLQKNDQSFANRPIPDSVAAQPNVQDTLAWSPADVPWRNRHRICTTQIFSNQRLDLLQHLRHQKVQQLLHHLHKEASTKTVVNIGELAFATMLNLVSNTVFSEDMVDPEFETAGELKDLVWRIMEDAGKVNLSDYFPGLKRFDLQGVRKHVRVSYVRLHEIFDDMIRKRIRKRESLSGSTMSTRSSFRETLRLHPPVPLLLPYIAGNDVEANGYTIHKGTQLLINAWSIGRNPEFWDDPLLFQPERFLRSNIDYSKGSRDFEYIPFGAGRRICPGLPLANRMIIHSFEWELPEGVTPHKLDMNEQYGITLNKLVPLSVIPFSV